MAFANLCALKIPSFNPQTPREHRENLLEFQRWTDRIIRDDGCLGTTDNYALNIPFLQDTSPHRLRHNYIEIQRWADRLIADHSDTSPFPSRCSLKIPHLYASTSEREHHENYLEIQRWSDYIFREGCFASAPSLKNVCGRRYDGTFTAGSPDNLDLSSCDVDEGDLMLIALSQNSVSSGACGGPDAHHNVPAATSLGSSAGGYGVSDNCQNQRMSLFWMTAPAGIKTNGIDFTHTDPRGSGVGGIGRIDVIAISGASIVAAYDASLAYGGGARVVGPVTGGNFIVIVSAPAATGPWSPVAMADGRTALYSGLGLAVYSTDGSAETTASAASGDRLAAWMVAAD